MQPIYASHTFTANQVKRLLEDFPQSEYAGRFGIVQCAFNVSAAQVTVNVWTGTNQVYNGLTPLVKGTAPNADDFLFAFPIAPGERLVLEATETAGATPSMLWAMRFLPA